MAAIIRDSGRNLRGRMDAVPSREDGTARRDQVGSCRGNAEGAAGLRCPGKIWEVTLSTETIAGEGTAVIRYEKVAGNLVRQTLKTYRGPNKLGVVSQSTAIYAGPVQLVEYQRAPPPIFGDLLPYTFWGKLELAGLSTQNHPTFPTRAASVFDAELTYYHYYATGEPMGSDVRKFACVTEESAPASSLGKELSGMAWLIRCNSKRIQGGGISEQTNVIWYVADHGFWVPVMTALKTDYLDAHMYMKVRVIRALE